jgi:hypothetical protein
LEFFILHFNQFTTIGVHCWHLKGSCYFVFAYFFSFCIGFWPDVTSCFLEV